MFLALLFLSFIAYFASAEYTCNAYPPSGLSISIVCESDGGPNTPPQTVSCLASKPIKSSTGGGQYCTVQQSKQLLQMTLAGQVKSPKWACATTLEFIDPSATVSCA